MDIVVEFKKLQVFLGRLKERVDRALADKDEYISHLQEEVEQLKEELERSHLENKEFREKLERVEK